MVLRTSLEISQSITTNRSGIRRGLVAWLTVGRQVGGSNLPCAGAL